MSERWDDAQMRTVVVGKYRTNCYVLAFPTGEGVLIDAGAEPDRLLRSLRGTTLKFILLTHGDEDHVEGLAQIRLATGAKAAIHGEDAHMLGEAPDILLKDGDVFTIGSVEVRVIGMPGHTPGSVGFQLRSALFAGDMIRAGGLGYVNKPEDLPQFTRTLDAKVFSLADATVLYPGHGRATTVGKERPGFRQFLQSPKPPGLVGKLNWDLTVLRDG
jgi:glyoxylase-like metal-dependent hydrolase (beta-lactamase superfamily II)